MKNSRKRILEREFVADGLRIGQDLTAEESAPLIAQYQQLSTEARVWEEKEGREDSDRQDLVKRITRRSTVLIPGKLADMDREELESLTRETVQDTHLLLVLWEKAQAEIEALKADVDAEYALAQALLRQRTEDEYARAEAER